jgi:predicted lysophospholipase L1 biosynthesis ABC-type transport system permease subunit
MGEEEHYSQKSSLVRYFLHGIAFSVLFSLLAIGWVFILAFLTVIGYIIGLMLGLIVLFLIIGGLNAFLTDFVWSIPVRSDWKGLLSHGSVLFWVLLVAGIPQYLVTLAAPSIVTSIVMFVVYAFIDGYVAKNVGKMWESEEEQE